MADLVNIKIGSRSIDLPDLQQICVGDFCAEIPQGGGGASGSWDDPVRFIDYDGTLLHSYSAADFMALDALPDNPSHQGLTAQGWNWSLASAKAQLTAMGACDIGQCYVTDDGKTRLYIELKEGRLSPYLCICPQGNVTVSWGDGSTGNFTGTSTETRKSLNHTYAAPGKYVISLEPTTGSKFAISCGTPMNTGLRILQTDNDSYGERSFVYTSTIKKIELGSNVSLGPAAFWGCNGLETITIPENLNFDRDVFHLCANLRSITVPNGVTEIGEYGIGLVPNMIAISLPCGLTTLGTRSLSTCGAKHLSLPYTVTSINTFALSGIAATHIVIPGDISAGSTTYNATGTPMIRSIVLKSATDIGKQAFQGVTPLVNIELPDTVTSIGQQAFQACPSLASITIPRNVTSIGTKAFYNCYGLGAIHFKPITPPVAASSDVWSGVPTSCKIYVPAGSLSAYTSAQYYPSSGTYTYVEE